MQLNTGTRCTILIVCHSPQTVYLDLNQRREYWFSLQTMHLGWSTWLQCGKWSGRFCGLNDNTLNHSNHDFLWCITHLRRFGCCCRVVIPSQFNIPYRLDNFSNIYCTPISIYYIWKFRCWIHYKMEKGKRLTENWLRHDFPSSP